MEAAQHNLDDIRQQARQLWLQSYAASCQQEERSSLGAAPALSSYRSHYSSRRGPQPLAAMAPQPPASPNRRNKPHPSQLFMTCRLHRVPDYNLDTSRLNDKGVQTDRRDLQTRGDIGGNSEKLQRPDHPSILKPVTGRYARGSSTAAGRSNDCDAHPEGLVFQPTRVRGDFAIHPDWPPTLAHHRVP